MAIYIRNCCVCNIEFEGGPRAWYCPACREERRRIRQRKYNSRPSKRKLGSIDLCANCGAEYVVASGLQKYCSACAEQMHKEVDRKQSLEYYHKNKDHINPARNARRRYSLKVCIICGKEFETHTRTNCCSDDCRREWRNSTYREIYNKRYKAKKKEKSGTK